MDLSLEQLYLIGLFAGLLAQGIKLVSARFGYTPSKLVTSVIVVVVALLLAFFFMKPALPDPSAPDFIPQLANLVTALVGAAMVIYNVLLAKLFELLGWTTAKVASKG